MEIEAALIQKKPFRSSHQKVMINLIYTSNQVKEKVNLHFKPYNITSKQYNVLRILKGAQKPISTSIIKDRLIDKMSDASRIVDRLYQKELIEKVICGSDRRLVDVSLSDKGNELIEEIGKDIDVLDQITNNLNVKEAEQLSRLLDKLRG